MVREGDEVGECQSFDSYRDQKARKNISEEMARVIVSTGRGGTGKSTFAAMISKYLAPPLLLIDVDPDQSLPDMLGVDLDKEGVSTISNVVSDVKKVGGLSSRLYFDELEASFYTNCIYKDEF